MCVLACAVAVRTRDRRRENERSRRAGRPWVRPWIERRESQDAFNMVGDLRAEDPCSFRNYLRMIEANFEELCGLVAPSIQQHDTNMRLTISVAQ